jgi:hypothetical protein
LVNSSVIATPFPASSNHRQKTVIDKSGRPERTKVPVFFPTRPSQLHSNPNLLRIGAIRFAIKTDLYLNG